MGRSISVPRDPGLVPESIWLSALALAPCFFNIESARHFEADKAIVVRVLAIALLAVEAFLALRRPVLGVATVREVWQRLRACAGRRILVGVALLVISTAVSTAFSVSWRLSTWGSYERRQGALTSLAYVAVFGIAVLRLDRRRIGRAVTVIGQSAVAVSVYALIQVSGLDPITWAIDADRRPTSTFGNAGAMAGYVAIAIPFLLVRFAGAWRSFRSREEARPVIGTLAIVATHVFLVGNVILASRTLGWFGEPARLALAIAVAASSWALIDSDLPAERRHFGRAVMVLAAGWIALTLVSLVGGSAATGTGLLLSAVSLVPVVAVARRQREAREREGTRPSFAQEGRLGAVGSLGVSAAGVLACAAAVLLSHSRGAQVGLFASLFVLFNLRSGRAALGSSGQEPTELRRTLMRFAAQGGVLALVLVANLSDHALLRRLRAVPYVGRLGQWLALDQGTGRERVLIWRGDQHGSGVLGLVSESPTRFLLGHGPETLRDEFARVFPPSLVEGNWNGASPDRAHNVALDALFTQGFFGICALLLVFGAAVHLAIRVSRGPAALDSRACLAACAAAIVGHVVTGAVGIPTTASLITVWLILAVCAAQRGLAASHVQAAPSLDIEAMVPVRQRWGAAVLVAGLAVSAGWYGNVSAMIADMLLGGVRRSEGDEPREAAIRRCELASHALELAPREDEYASELGESLVTLSRLAPARVASSQVRDPSVAATACRRLANESAPELLARARAAFERALVLAPRNKDRSAAVAYAELLLFERGADPGRLEECLRWYASASASAPTDVMLLNQRASVTLLAGPSRRDQAERLLRRSLVLDPKMPTTRLQLGLLLLDTGRIAEGATEIEHVLSMAPTALWSADGSRLGAVLTKVRGEPELLRGHQRALAGYADGLRRDLRAAAADRRPAYIDELTRVDAMMAQLVAFADASRE